MLRLISFAALDDPDPTRQTHAQARAIIQLVKELFQDFFKVPFGNSSSRIEPRGIYLGGDFGGLPLDDQAAQKIHFSSPSPSLPIAAAATSLTSFY